MKGLSRDKLGIEIRAFEKLEDVFRDLFG
jgi:hypothetical protein